MSFQNAGNAISETQILKISWGACPQIPLTNSCLWYSAHTFGDRILGGRRAKKMGLLPVLPHHRKIPKNALGTGTTGITGSTRTIFSQ
jgi:hypothetical protein